MRQRPAPRGDRRHAGVMARATARWAAPGLAAAAWRRWLMVSLLVAIGLHLAGLLPGLARIERLGRAVWRRIEPRARRLLPVRTPGQALALGALWGFLPCGLVYTMLLTAAASGGIGAGAVVMAAFGLGTLPALLAAGLWFGRFEAVVRRRGARLAAGLAVAAFGVHGLVVAGASIMSGADPHAHHRHGGAPSVQAARA